MQRLLKAYVAIACTLFGALLAGGVVLLVLSWLAPGLVSAAWTRASRQPSQLAGGSLDVSSAVSSGVTPAAVALLPAGGLDAPPGAGQTENRAAEQANRDGWIDIGALEARLRLLDRAVPPWSFDSAASASVSSARDKRLEAWESLKRPLIGFLNATTESVAESPPFPEEAVIESIASEVSARLDALRAEYATSASKILKTLEPSAIARLLADDKALTEDRARLILSRLPAGEATEVMEKLSRLAPGKAARLLEKLAWTKDKVDG